MFVNLFLKLFRRLDYFSTPVNMKINSSDSHPTMFGSGLTLLYGISFCLITFFFGKDIYQRKRPELMATQFFDTTPPRTSFSPNDGPMFFGLIDESTLQYFNDPSYYHVNFSQVVVKWTTHENGTRTKDTMIFETEAIPCDKSFHITKPELKDDGTYQSVPIQKFYCFDHANMQFQPYVQGNLDISDYQGITAFFYRCENTTEKQICKSPEEIEQKLKKSWINFYYTDMIVQPTDFGSPFKYFIGNLYQKIMTGFTKYWYLDYTRYFINSDEGLVVESLSERTEQKFNVFRSSLLFENAFAKIDIQPSFWNNQIKRIYTKLPKIIAEVGGFMSIILIFVKLISAAFIQSDLELDLINGLINFQHVNQNYIDQPQHGADAVSPKQIQII